MVLFSQIAKKYDKNKIVLYNNHPVEIVNFFTANSDLLGLNAGTQMIERNTTIDKTGIKHSRFKSNRGDLYLAFQTK